MVSGVTSLDAPGYTVDLTGATANIFGTLNITANKVSLNGDNLTYTSLNLTGVTDVAVSANANISLSDTTLTIGALPAINATGITQAELTVTGAASHTIDITGFTHPSTLAGDATFTIGPNFADTTLPLQPTLNDNTIDITGVGDPLSGFTVSGNKGTITDTAISGTPGHGHIFQTIDATHGPAAHIDVTLASGMQAAFVTFLTNLVMMAQALETNNPIPQLNSQLPLLSRLKNAAGKAANLLSALGLPNVFTTLENDVNAFPPQTKLSGLITQLDSIGFTAPGTDDTLGLGISGASTGYQGGTGGPAGGTLALLLNLPVTAEQKESFPIDLGA